MTSPDKDLLILFLHIPKTGGTTLWSVLYRFYSHRHSLRIMEGSIARNDAALREILRGDSSRYKALGGHVPYGVHTDTQRPTAYMTMLRDPVQWLFSSYYKILRREGHPLHDKFVGEKIDLATGIGYLEDNLQTRMLAGLDETGACTEAHLETAKQTLRDKIGVFGLMEQYDESLVLFRRFYGWRTPYYFRKNVGTNVRPKSQHTPEIVALAQQHNHLDMQLYAYAVALFEERVQAQTRSVARETATLRRMNGLYSRWAKLIGRR